MKASLVSATSDLVGRPRDEGLTPVPMPTRSGNGDGTSRRRSQYLSATVLARWPAALVALALAPSAAGAATINIPTSCTLTGPGVCNATSLLASPGSPSDTIAFLGGVLTLNGAGKTYSQQATLNTTPTNILNQDSRNTTFSGVFSNATVSPGSIEIKNVDPGTGNPAAGGAVTFSAANTYTGTTTIDPGASLKLGATGSISNSAVVDNGALSIAADTSIPTLSGGGSVSLTGGGILTLSNASGIFSGIISGGGGVTIGGGSETLSGANTYTGATAIGAGGKLSISGSGSIAGSSNVDVANAGEFNIASASGDVSIKALTGAAGSSVMVGGNTLILTNAGNKTFSGTISGTGGFSVQKGTETFDTGAQKYTGLTTVSPAGTANATLKLSGTGDIGASSGVAVDSSGTAKGTFDIAGITASGTTIRTLAGSGNVNLGTKVLTLSNASGVFTGVISGSGTANGLTIAKGTESSHGRQHLQGHHDGKCRGNPTGDR